MLKLSLIGAVLIAITVAIHGVGTTMLVRHLTSRFLDEHGLPDGNLYKMEGGTGTLNNQGSLLMTIADLSAEAERPLKIEPDHAVP